MNSDTYATTQSNAIKLAYSIYDEVILYPWQELGLCNWVRSIHVLGNVKFFVSIVANQEYGKILALNNHCVPIWHSSGKYLPVPGDPDLRVLTAINFYPIKWPKGAYNAIVFDEELGIIPGKL